MDAARMATIVAASAGLLTCAVRSEASDTAYATVTVTASVATRTSLRVSGDVLRFDVSENGRVATAAIDFSAGIRIPSSTDLVLTVEPLGAIEGPGGAADADAAISFDGEGDGARSGQLGSVPSIAGRWHGSGFRQGRLFFRLRASASGRYVLPVRFVLSTP
jgi:hypothetical protein